MSGGFKEQSLKSTEADNSTVLEIKQAGQKRAWQGRDLLELRWTKEMSDFGNRDRWHLYRDAVCATAGREVVLTKLDCSFSGTAPQEGLFKNVNNKRRTRNDTGLLLFEVGHLKNRDMK